MDEIVLREFRRRFGIEPEQFVNVSSYISSLKKNKLELVNNFERAFVYSQGRIFDFFEKNYEITDRDNEIVGFIDIKESIFELVYEKRIVGGVHRIEVFNEFAEAVSSKDFLANPYLWYKKIQSAYNLVSGARGLKQETYSDALGVFLEEDFLLDLISNKIVFKQFGLK